ncbi:MAG: lipid-A-disaccharide synthase [bacterium]
MKGNDVRHIFLSCGEASGDRYGADLISALRSLDPDLRISAMGGELVAAAGAEIVASSEPLAVMGFTEVVQAWPEIRSARRSIDRFLKAEKVDLVIPLDFPGFNGWLAGRARSLGIPVFWLIAPQLWAWGGWRTRGFRGKIDRLGTILPFEADFFRQRGFDVFPMGHPLMDDYGGGFPFQESQTLRERNLHDRDKLLTIGLFPGSRRQELDHLLPTLKVTAQAVVGHLGNRPLKFLASVAPGIDPRLVRDAFEGQVETTREPVAKILPGCDLALVCSGTVSLEAALAGVPHELVYHTGAFNYFIARKLVRVPYIGLSNLLLDRPVVREHVQEGASPLPLARSLLRWIARPAEREVFYGDCRELRGKCGAPGVWRRTAAEILRFAGTGRNGAGG